MTLDDNPMAFDYSSSAVEYVSHRPYHDLRRVEADHVAGSRHDHLPTFRRQPHQFALQLCEQALVGAVGVLGNEREDVVLSAVSQDDHGSGHGTPGCANLGTRFLEGLELCRTCRQPLRREWGSASASAAVDRAPPGDARQTEVYSQGAESRCCADAA